MCGCLQTLAVCGGTWRGLGGWGVSTLHHTHQDNVKKGVTPWRTTHTTTTTITSLQIRQEQRNVSVSVRSHLQDHFLLCLSAHRWKAAPSDRRLRWAVTRKERVVMAALGRKRRNESAHSCDMWLRSIRFPSSHRRRWSRSASSEHRVHTGWADTWEEEQKDTSSEQNIQLYLFISLKTAVEKHIYFKWVLDGSNYWRILKEM